MRLTDCLGGRITPTRTATTPSRLRWPSSAGMGHDIIGCYLLTPSWRTRPKLSLRTYTDSNLTEPFTAGRPSRRPFLFLEYFHAFQTTRRRISGDMGGSGQLGRHHH